MGKIVIYPGSFDPITYGHLDIIKRAIKVFDKVVVAVAHDAEKEPLLDVSERVELLKRAVKGIRGVEVDDFKGLVVDYVKKKKASVVIRGLRMISDFEYEFQMALMNMKLDPEIETLFMMPNVSFTFLSSRLVKEVAMLGGTLEGLVPRDVEKKLKQKFKESPNTTST